VRKGTRQAWRETGVAAIYYLVSVALVLLCWAVSGRFATAFRGQVDWPVRTGGPNQDLPVPAWCFYVLFPALLLSLALWELVGRRKRRRLSEGEWWDYSPDEICAMSLDELRQANERALEELEPLATAPPEGRERAVLAHDRYERLRDAYYSRRDK
jgi:hypothetical protein